MTPEPTTQPQVLPIGQAPIVPNSLPIQIDPNQPIKLQIVYLGGKKAGGFVCQCGNIDQQKFEKFLARKLVKNEKGYDKEIRVMELMCSVKKCHASIPFHVIQEQYRLLTQS